MGLRIIETSTPPVTVEEMATHLRIEHTDDNDLLTGLIAAATDFIQSETGQTLATTEYELTLSAFPSGRDIRLPKFPLQEVDTIYFTDASGTQQALDPSIYTEDTASMPGRLVLNPGHSWPQTNGKANSVSICFTAGYSEG
jgi:uncharacterized phiE125 gp8 family phage protein